MPIQVNKSFFKNIDVSIWHIDESEDFLISKIDLTKNCKERLDSIKSNQLRKQFLSVRNLIKQKKIDLNDLYYDSDGAPFLKSNNNISISHTNNFSAIGISHHPVGIDIQDFRAKISYIKNKFLNHSETKLFDVDSVRDLTLAWSIKEAVYKIHKKKGLSFKNNIKIHSFTNDFKNSFILVDEINKKTFYKSENIIHSNYICSIVKSDE